MYGANTCASAIGTVKKKKKICYVTSTNKASQMRSVKLQLTLHRPSATARYQTRKYKKTKRNERKDNRSHPTSQYVYITCIVHVAITVYAWTTSQSTYAWAQQSVTRPMLRKPQRGHSHVVPGEIVHQRTTASFARLSRDLLVYIWPRISGRSHLEISCSLNKRDSL